MEFNPSRLTLARKRRGWTKAKLAAEAKVSARSITSYETGAAQPSPLTAVRISNALGFPSSFFESPDDLDELPTEAPSFRALSRLTARERDQAFAAAAIAVALNRWINTKFDSLPSPNIPRLRGLDPESAAEAVREIWGLGVKPIRNMIHLLERHGVRVFSLGEDYASVDAFSVWHKGTPFMFATQGKTAERQRMDAAHELGHLVLHGRHGAPRGREYEREADLFGSAFLMPKPEVIATMPVGADLDQIIKAKARWKVSAKALAYRMRQLGLLTEWQHRTVMIQLNERGFSRSEPEPISAEKSQILDKVFAALRQTGINKADVAESLHVPVGDIDEIIFGLALTAVDGGRNQDDEAPADAGELQHQRPHLRLV